MVSDIAPGAASSRPGDLAEVDGRLLFTAEDGTNGRELWRSDGSAGGTSMVKDINPGARSSFELATSLVVTPNRTLYLAANDGSTGTELWKSDGTTAGTTLVKDINAGTASSSPANLRVYGDYVVFGATTAEHGTEPWIFNAAIDDVVTWTPTLALDSANSPATLAAASTSSRSTVTYAVTDAGSTGCSIATGATPVLTFTGSGNCSVRASTAKTQGFRPGSATVTFTISSSGTTTTTPIPTKTLPFLTKKKPVTAKVLVKFYEIKVPKKSTVSITVKKSSAKVCQATTTSVKYLKPGRCAFTLTVQPPTLKSGKKAKAIKRSGVLIAAKR
jgi:ELWxxDGT repeat protein